MEATGKCVNVFIVSIPLKSIRKKEKCTNSKWILMDFFCPRSNRSNHTGNDDIISQRPDLKTGVKNGIFFVLNRVRIWKPERHTHTKNSQ